MDAMNHRRPDVSQEDQRFQGWIEELAAPPSLAAHIFARLEATTQLRSKDALLNALHDPDWTVRTAAVQELARLGEPALLEPLQTALHDEHTSVRAASIYALGQPAFNAPLSLFAHALQDPEWQVREKAVLALARQHTRQALELLQSALYDPHPAVRDTTTYALQSSMTTPSIEQEVAEISTSSLPRNLIKNLYHRLLQTDKKKAYQQRVQGEMHMPKIPESYATTPMEPINTPPRRPKRRNFTSAIALAIIVVLVVVWAVVLQLHVLPGANPAVHPTATPASTKPGITPTPSPSPAAITHKTADIVHTYNSQFRDVFSAAWSPDDQRIVMVDNAVKSWDATTGQNPITYPEQMEGGATAVTYSPDGRFISGTGTYAELWNATSGQALGTLTPPIQPGKTLALYKDFVNATWSPDSSLIAISTSSTGYQTGIYVYSPQTRQLVLSIPISITFTAPMPYGSAFSDIKWSTDSKSLMFETGGKILVYSVVTKSLVSQISGLSAGSAFTWSPDGTKIAELENCGSTQPILSIWDSHTGNRLLHIPTSFQAPCVYTGIIAWSPDGSKIAAIDGCDLTMPIWDSYTGKLLTRITYGNLGQGKGCGGTSAPTWSPDGKSIAIATLMEQAVAVVHVDTGKVLLEDTQQVWNGGNGVHAVLWSHDSKMIATNSGGENGPGKVQVWVP